MGMEFGINAVFRINRDLPRNLNLNRIKYSI